MTPQFHGSTVDSIDGSTGDSIAGFLAGGAASVLSTVIASPSSTAGSGFFRLIKWLMSLAFGLSTVLDELLDAPADVLDEAASESASDPPPINAPMPAVEINLDRIYFIAKKKF